EAGDRQMQKFVNGIAYPCEMTRFGGVVAAAETPSYWLEEPCESWPAADVAAPVDVAVIGGGVTGCSCAFTLAQAGVRVRVYEARQIAGGASGRNGGFALRGGAMPYDQAVASMGRERARQLWQLSERALDRLESLAGDAFRRVGSLRVAA